jgi:hypothetical protein
MNQECVHTGVLIDAPPAYHVWPTELHLIQRRAVPCVGHLPQSALLCLSQSSLLCRCSSEKAKRHVAKLSRLPAGRD